MFVKWSLKPEVNSGVVEVDAQATYEEIEEAVRKEVVGRLLWERQDQFDPIGSLNELKYAYYMVYMMAHDFNRWMDAVETTELQQAVVHHTLELWKREANTALENVYSQWLAELKSTQGKDLENVIAVNDRAEEIAKALLSHLPKAVIEWEWEAREKQDVSFHHVCGYGKYWNEVELPEAVEILFQRFCQLIDAHTDSENIPEGAVAISLYNLSDAAIVVPTRREAEEVLESYSCSPFSLMTFHQGAWFSN